MLFKTKKHSAFVQRDIERVPQDVLLCQDQRPWSQASLPQPSNRQSARSSSSSEPHALQLSNKRTKREQIKNLEIIKTIFETHNSFIIPKSSPNPDPNSISSSIQFEPRLKKKNSRQKGIYTMSSHCSKQERPKFDQECKKRGLDYKFLKGKCKEMREKNKGCQLLTTLNSNTRSRKAPGSAVKSSAFLLHHQICNAMQQARRG